MEIFECAADCGHDKIRSQFELLCVHFLERFLSAVLQLEHALGGLSRHVALNLDLAVLFPAAHVVRHLVGKVDLLFQVGVHLLLDGVWLTLSNEGTAVVDARHHVEVLVLS